jgi:hypothetical protein
MPHLGIFSCFAHRLLHLGIFSYNEIMSKDEEAKKPIPQIERGSFKHLIFQMIAFTVAALIIFPLGDWLWDLIFTHKGFEFSVGQHIIEPIVFGVVAGLVFWFFDRRAMKTAKKK